MIGVVLPRGTIPLPVQDRVMEYLFLLIYRVLERIRE